MSKTDVCELGIGSVDSHSLMFIESSPLRERHMQGGEEKEERAKGETIK